MTTFMLGDRVRRALDGANGMQGTIEAYGVENGVRTCHVRWDNGSVSTTFEAEYLTLVESGGEPLFKAFNVGDRVVEFDAPAVNPRVGEIIELSAGKSQAYVDWSGHRKWVEASRLKFAETEPAAWRNNEPEPEPFEVQLKALDGSWFTITRCAHRSHAETLAGSMGVQYEELFETRVLPIEPEVCEEYAVQVFEGGSWTPGVAYDDLGAAQHDYDTKMFDYYSGELRIVKITRTTEVIER